MKQSLNYRIYCAICKLSLVMTCLFTSIRVAIPSELNEIQAHPKKGIEPTSIEKEQKKVSKLSFHQSLFVHDSLTQLSHLAGNGSLKNNLAFLQNMGIASPKKGYQSLSTTRKTAFVSDIINTHNEEISSFYHKYLKKNPEVSGKVLLRIFINPSGQVESVDIKTSTFSDSLFVNHLRNIIQSWNDFGIWPGKEIKVYRQEYIFGEE